MSGSANFSQWRKRAALFLSFCALASCSVVGPPSPAPEPQVTPSPIMSPEERAARQATWTFYRQSIKAGPRLWFWKETAPNGRQIGEADQGYQRIFFAKKNAAKHGWVEGQSVTKIE